MLFLLMDASRKKLINASEMSYFESASCSRRVEILVKDDFIALIKSLELLFVLVEILAP